MDSDAIIVEKEMGITHAEFMRLLPRALGAAAFEVHGNRIEVTGDNGQRLTIDLGPERERRIALMCMPATPVSLTFNGYAPADVEGFLHVFDRCYQRGGG